VVDSVIAELYINNFRAKLTKDPTVWLDEAISPQSTFASYIKIKKNIVLESANSIGGFSDCRIVSRKWKLVKSLCLIKRTSKQFLTPKFFYEYESIGGTEAFTSIIGPPYFKQNFGLTSNFTGLDCTTFYSCNNKL
jgi:hypothetical protein